MVDTAMTNPSLPRLLFNAFRWFDDALRQSLAARNLPSLTYSQSLVMSSLTTKGVRISEIARRLDMTRQGAQKTVAGLETAGLVYTETDPSNSSAKIVRLTKLGFNTIEVAQDIFEQLERELARRVGGPNVTAMRGTLEQHWGDPPKAG